MRNTPVNSVDPKGLAANEIVLADHPVELTRAEAGIVGWSGVQEFAPTIYIPVSFRDNPSAFNPFRSVGPSDEFGVGRYYPEIGVVEYKGREGIYRTSLSKLQQEANTDRPATDRLNGGYWDKWFKDNDNDKLRPGSKVIADQFAGMLDPDFHDRIAGFQNTATLLANINYLHQSISAGLASPNATYQACQQAIFSAGRSHISNGLGGVCSGQRTYGVSKDMVAKDMQAGGIIKNGQYVRNPTAQPILSALDKNGRLGQMNGQYMYALDDAGNLIVGSRGKDAAGNTLRMPHPTLIGGAAPRVRAAGMVEIRGGQIYSISNGSGHFQAGVESLGAAKEAFMQLPKSAFHKNFQGYMSVYN